MLDYIKFFIKDCGSAILEVGKVIGKAALWAGIIISLVLMYRAGWMA